MDQPDLVYKNEQAKFAAVVEDIAEHHAAGSRSSSHDEREKSEYLSNLLTKAGVSTPS